MKEGEKVKVKVKMTGNSTLSTPLVVTLSQPAVAEPAAESTDYSGVPATVTIPAGAWFQEFEITATGDRILEESENFDIEATANIGVTVSTHKTTLTILDTTGLNPDNRVITLSVPAGKETETVGLKASLPDGVTTEKAILVTLDHMLGAAGNTADANDVVTMPPA